MAGSRIMDFAHIIGARARDIVRPRTATPRATKKASAKPQRAPSAAPVPTLSESVADMVDRLCREQELPLEFALKLKAEVILTYDEARARVENAAKVKNLVRLAKEINPTVSPTAAHEFIMADLSAEQARAAIYQQVLDAQSPEIVNAVVPAGRPDPAKAWSKATSRVNAERGLL